MFNVCQTSMRQVRYGFTIATVLLVCSLYLQVGCKKKDIIKVDQDWVSESIPGSRISAAYMNLVNTSEADDTLLSADTDAFETVEFHNLIEDDGVTRMEFMESVAIPAGQSVQFTPGGMHIMLINRKKELKSGDYIELNLHFENAGLVTRKSPVKSMEEQVK